MTTLYRPVPITSAEQAEALHVGTLVPRTNGRLPKKREDGTWGDLWGDCDLFDVIGHTAFVPIEAEEEWTAMGSDNGEPWIAHVGHGGLDGSREEAEAYTRRFGGFVAHRALTGWEEA